MLLSDPKNEQQQGGQGEQDVHHPGNPVGELVAPPQVRKLC